jgi:hypothetical protein
MTEDNKRLRTKRQKQSGKTILKTSGCVRRNRSACGLNPWYLRDDFYDDDDGDDDDDDDNHSDDDNSGDDDCDDGDDNDDIKWMSKFLPHKIMFIIYQHMHK